VLACLTMYTPFGADGTFSQTLGSDTWLEPFQGVDSEGCGAPVSPHDGNFENGSYQVGDSSITINGTGAHIGLAKVVNSGELESSSALLEVSRTQCLILPMTEIVLPYK
jgi:hypothetical protein